MSLRLPYAVHLLPAPRRPDTFGEVATMLLSLTLRDWFSPGLWLAAPPTSACSP